MRIELVGAGFSYLAGSPLEERALAGVDFSVASGEIVGLIGPTGSGKSTLIQLLNGLLLPTEGRVAADGHDIAAGEISLTELRRRVGLVFQFPESQLFEETVFDDVAFGPRNTGCPVSELEDRVRWALALVGLPHEKFADRSPFSLSGGEMRRAAIAGVLAMRPEIVVLDEPTAGLDPLGRTELLAHLRELEQSEGIGVVLVSHNMDEVAGLCGRVVVLSAGRVVAEGSPRQVFREAERLVSLGLDLPQPTQLLLELSRCGWEVQTDLHSLEDCAQEVLRVWR